MPQLGLYGRVVMSRGPACNVCLGPFGAGSGPSHNHPMSDVRHLAAGSRRQTTAAGWKAG